MTELKVKGRFFIDNPRFSFFVQELNPDIDPAKLRIRSGKELRLRCPDCRHEFTLSPHGLKNCRFCEHQALCENDDCEMCFENSLASRHFASVDIYKQYKQLCESNADYSSIISLFLATCAIYDFRNNKESCRSTFKSISNKTRKFICWKCEHSFPNAPSTVASLKDCPFCSPTNPRILCPKEKECNNCFVKSFASHPKAEFWDSSEGKNNGKTPYDVFKSGTHVADFVCGECNHSFQSACNTISTQDCWCPYCVGQSRCSATDCKMCNDRKLASHPMAEFWDYEQNPKDITPADIALGNGKDKYWFTCPEKKHKSFKKPPSKINGGCPWCLRKTESKIGTYLESIGKVEREWSTEWLRNPLTNQYYRFDFMIPLYKAVAECDGLAHFIDGRWKGKAYITSEIIHSRNCRTALEQQHIDIMKMKKAVSNGVSGMRLYQPDVLNDTFDWKGWIEKAIAHISSSTRPVWVFPNNKQYDAHIRLCVEHEINYVIIDAL